MADRPNTETQDTELAAIRAKPDISEADAKRAVEVTRQRTEVETGRPVRAQATFDAAANAAQSRIDAAHAEMAKLPEGHPRIAHLIETVLAATQDREAIREQRGLLDTETDARARDAALDEAPLYLPPLDRYWAGDAWDETELRALRSAMHREGAGDKFQAVVTVIADLLNTKAEAPPDHEHRSTMLERWGSDFDRKRDAHELAWSLFTEAMPKQAAQIESRRLDLHPRFVNVLADVGLSLLDVSTARGAARQTALVREKLAARRKAG